MSACSRDAAGRGRLARVMPLQPLFMMPDCALDIGVHYIAADS